MHDFHCKKPEDMHDRELADRVRYFKEDEKGVTAMCRAMEEMRREAAEKARLDVAIELLKDHLSIAQIAKATKLSAEKITEAGRLHGLL